MTLYGFRIPLRVPFRGVKERAGVLTEGTAGWGEYSPFPGYSDGRERDAWRAAVSCAAQPWPRPVRTWVQVHATVPEVSPGEAMAMVAESGCSAAKVKVGDAGDEARVEAVRAALGPAGRLIVDANGRWDLEEAGRKIRTLGRYGIDLAEQPVASRRDMAHLRRVVDVPLAADEIMQSPEDAKGLAEDEAADVIVIKVQSIGGIAEGMRAVEESGLPAVVSSPVETSIGIAAGLALAAALPELPFSCGLGTATLLAGDLVADPLVPAGGRLEVRRPDPDPGCLERFAADVSPPLPMSPAGTAGRRGKRAR